MTPHNTCTASFFRQDNATTPYDYAPPPQWGDLVGQELRRGDQGEVSYSLDVGCGPGQFLRPLSDLTSDCVIGLDSSPAMLRQARRKWGSKFPLLQAHASALPFPSGSFDLVLLRYLLHHLHQPALAVVEASRLLRPGGCLLIETSDPAWLKDQPEYRDFPMIAAVDLSRWPTMPQTVEWMNACEMDLQSYLDVHLLRDHVGKMMYLERLELWKDEGGGTSFWRLFDRDQRRQFVNMKAQELSLKEDTYCVPIRSDGIMLVGRKR
ncbi:MAG: class I SAM-dependent methyltransferase [Sulfuricaulis sp.]